MRNWTSDEALAELDTRVSEITPLRQEHRKSANHVRWTLGVLAFLEEVFGQNSRLYRSFAAIKWYRTGEFMITGTLDPQPAIDRLHHEAYLRDLESARGLLLAARDAIVSSGLDNVYEGKDTPPEASDIIKIFGLVERKLRKVIRTVPEKETTIQEAVEHLLIGADIQYEREGPSIEYSSKKYKPDFAFERLDLVLEIKLCHRSEREKELIAEINDDILAYGTRFGNLLFLVYDIGFIRDVDKFAQSFEAHDDVTVRIIKH